MPEKFTYFKLKWKHKKVFLIHQIILLVSIVLIISLAVHNTNPVVESTSAKIELTLGGTFTVMIIALAMTNRLKKLLKVKFTVFLIMYVILLSMNSIMSTLIWGIGAAIIPLAIDDIIMSAYWNKVWYNEYDK